MADLAISATCVKDCVGQATTDAFLEYIVTDGAVSKRYSSDFRQVTLGLDTSVNYFEIRLNEVNVYRYKQGDTLNSGAVTNAADMYTQVRNLISA